MADENSSQSGKVTPPVSQQPEKATLPSEPHTNPLYIQPLAISKSELQVFFNESVKYTAFGVFALYSIGFLIWHSYLGCYGVFSFDFFQVEYFSAAICYLIFVAMFALPPVLIFNRWFGKCEPGEAVEPIYSIFFVWYLISQQFVGRFFSGPFNHIASPISVFFIVFTCVMLLNVVILFFAMFNLHFQWTVARGWKWSPAQIRDFVNKWDLFSVCMVGLLCINIFSIPELNRFFLLVTVFLYPILAYGIGSNVQNLWNKGGAYKLLIVTFCGLVIIGDIQLFGVSQFGQVSRQMGGGKPEMAYVKFDSQHLALPASLNMPVATNVTGISGFFGPVKILFRTDKQIIFLNPDEVNWPAAVTNDAAVDATTNSIVLITTNQLNQRMTNTIVQVSKNVDRSVAGSPAKLAAKQVRGDLIDVIIFTR